MSAIRLIWSVRNGRIRIDLARRASASLLSREVAGATDRVSQDRLPCGALGDSVEDRCSVSVFGGRGAMHLFTLLIICRFCFKIAINGRPPLAIVESALL